MVGRGVYGESHEMSFVAGSTPALLPGVSKVYQHLFNFCFFITFLEVQNCTFPVFCLSE